MSEIQDIYIKSMSVVDLYLKILAYKMVNLCVIVLCIHILYI